MIIKSKRTKIILAAIIAIIVIFSLVFIGYNYMMFKYFKNMFPSETVTHCDDGKYFYVQISSEKKLICTLNIYETKYTEGREEHSQVIFVYTLNKFFRDRDIRKLSWGVNSYDLFFDSRDVGIFCYAYKDGEWIGTMGLDEERTKEAIKGGNSDIYYFYGDRQVAALKSPTNPGGYERISGEIPRQNIPPYFLNKFDKHLQ